MAKNRISLGFDGEAAERAIEDLPDAVDEGASDAVRQLAVLAENDMKDHAPEGAGRDKHLRDTIDTRFRRGGLAANVGARKRAQDGNLLALYVVEGTTSSSYDDTGPPVQPLLDWADAKLGDPGIGWYIQEQIREGGHETLPNPFVDESLDDWEDRVEGIAGEQVRDAMAQLMRGA